MCRKKKRNLADNSYRIVFLPCDQKALKAPFACVSEAGINKITRQFGSRKLRPLVIGWVTDVSLLSFLNTDGSTK